MSFYSFITTGDLVGNDFCYHVIPEKLDIFVIRPQTPLDIGRMCHDVNKIENAYQRGRTDALNSLNKMIAFMTMN